MSWLARSIANSLRIDDNEDEDETQLHSRYESATCSPTINQTQSLNQSLRLNEYEYEDELDDGCNNKERGGVKDDLSEFTETLTRQLWGMATFLAPPPQQPDQDASCCEEDASESRLANDFVNDDGGSRFGSEIRNSSNLEVGRLKEDNSVEEEEAIGVTEEVLAFVMNIANHPETWLDFPLSDQQHLDDFDMSDTQWNHAIAIERLSPRLAALRIEFCPAHMTESYFWKVYFVLLHSRLNKHDNELLSTPQVVAARSLWMHELQKRTKPESDWSPKSPAISKELTYLQQNNNNPTLSESVSGNMSLGPSTFDLTTPDCAVMDFETQKHRVVSSENEVVDKSVIREESLPTCPSYKVPPVQEYVDDDDVDSWLQDNSDLEGDIGTTFFVANDEDVSFSDLEADDDCTMPIKSKTDLST